MMRSRRMSGWQTILNVITIISASLYSARMTYANVDNMESWHCILSAALSAICVAVIIYRYGGLEKLLKSITLSKAGLAVAFAACSINSYCISTGDFNGLIGAFPSNRLLTLITGLISAYGSFFVNFLLLFFVFLIYLWVFDKAFVAIPRFWKSMDKVERRFLFIGSIVYCIIVFIIYPWTNLFYFPASPDGLSLGYDSLYNMDSGLIAASSVPSSAYMNFFSWENDLRQPLFGLFSQPFAVLSYIISIILFLHEASGYAVAIAMVQIVVMQVTIILVARLMDLKQIKKIAFMLLIEVSYPVLLFSICIEQYVYPVFWMVWLIYSSLRSERDLKLLYIASTGSLITSGIMLPVLAKGRKASDVLKSIGNIALEGVAIVSVFGFLPTLINIQQQFARWVHAAEISFLDKLYQFSSFVSYCFAAPAHQIEASPEYGFSMFSLATPKTLSVVGAALFVTAIIGFVFSRKDKFSRVLLLWLGLSLFVMLVFGWGANQNAFIVYSYYFVWPYVCFVFKAADRIFGKNDKWFFIIIGVVVALLVYVNLSELVEVIRFGWNAYPTAMRF